MREPPRGPIKWIRRRVLPAAGKLAAWVGVLVLVVFGVGRVLTDQHHWSQYLWWVPASWTLAAAWGLLALSTILSLGSTRLGGAFVRPFLLVGALAATGWVAFGEWHLERLAFPVRSPGPAVRVAHWNLSANAPGGDLSGFIAAREPDVAFVMNARYDDDRAAMVEGLRALAGEGDGESHFLQRGRMMVASRLPIVGYGVAVLEKLEAPGDWPTSHDAGQVAFVELDASGRFPGLGRPLVVWVVDLPSDPNLWRMELTRAAARAVGRWSGPVQRPDEGGRLRPVAATGPFPDPDVVVGDFNTPRGSASLRGLVGAMREAHAASGAGPDASFRARYYGFGPGWHIDLAFVGDGWRASGYELARRPPIRHAMQWFDLGRDAGAP